MSFSLEMKQNYWSFYTHYSNFFIKSFLDHFLVRRIEPWCLDLFVGAIINHNFPAFGSLHSGSISLVAAFPRFFLNFFYSLCQTEAEWWSTPSKVLHEVFNKSLMEKRSPLFSPRLCSVFCAKLCVATSLHKWSTHAHTRTHTHTQMSACAHVHTHTDCLWFPCSPQRTH